MGLITYLYRGYNPVTKYHGHPSSAMFFLVPLMNSSLSLKTSASRLAAVKKQFFSGEDTRYNVIIAFISAKKSENAENPIFWGSGS